MALSIDEKAVITTTTWSGSRSRISRSTSMPEHAGQHEVEQHEVDLLALEHVERLLAGAAPRRVRVPLLAEQRGEDVLEDLLVVDDRGCSCALGSPAAGAGSSTGSRRPAPGLARRPRSVAAVAAHDLVADRQAQAGAAAASLVE